MTTPLSPQPSIDLRNAADSMSTDQKTAAVVQVMRCIPHEVGCGSGVYLT